MMKLTPWIAAEGCAYRAYHGTDYTDPKNRVAFIEKTPRVRIRDADWAGGDYPDYINWVERRFKGAGPDDQASRQWCDDMLKLLGYYEDEV